MQAEYEMLRQVSRTFALSIEYLPTSLRDTVTLGYLLFRVSDCIEDHAELPVTKKVQLLRLWAQILVEELPVEVLLEQLADLDSSDGEVYVAQHADLILDKLAMLPPILRKITREGTKATALGMARWQVHGPYVETEAALDDYMYEVAGRVGHLLTKVFAWYIPNLYDRHAELNALACEFGLALQTVNIIRGMRKDYERGWVFVPQSFYEGVGLTRDSLFEPANIDSAMKVVARLTTKAEKHLQNGLNYILAIPQRYYHIRLACMWPLFLATKTLALSRNNPAVLLSEAKITRADVRSIILNTKLFGWSNSWLRYYYQQLL
ncbi:MAG: squalene/phytoene synthase family protein [Chloroflexota bacterium]|nr:squalene/phytoene synthase family protein [Chloroflexota bacterium]